MKKVAGRGGDQPINPGHPFCTCPEETQKPLERIELYTIFC